MTRLRFFTAWARFLASHYRLVLGLALALTAASLLAATRIQIKGGRVDLLGADDPVAQAWLAFGRDFGSPNNVVLMVEGATAERRRQAVDRIVATLRPHLGDLYRNILYRVDPDYQAAYGPYYLSTGALTEARRALDALAAGGSAPTWPAVFETLEAQTSRQLRQGLDDQRNLTILDALVAMTQSWADTMEGAPPPARDALVPAASPLAFDNRLSPVDGKGYLVSNDGTRHILVIDPAAAREDSAQFLLPFMRTLFAGIDAARADVPEVHVRLAGLSAYAYQDINVIQHEMPWLTVIALVGLIIMFRAAFRSLRPALYAGVALVIAVCWTLGLTALTVGHLTLLSSTFGLILLGLGIDYGVHLFARYQEERRTHEAADALAEAYAHGVNAIVTGGVTTAAAFGLCALADFAAFAELGKITAIGIGCNLVAMLTVLPALVLHREAVEAAAGRTATFGAARYNRWLEARFDTAGAWLERHAWVGVAVGLAVAVWAVPRVNDVPFDYTFLAMQPKDSPYPEAERLLAATTNFAPHFDIAIVDGAAEARAIAERVDALPTVSHTMYAQQALPEPDPARDAALQDVRAAALALAAPAPPDAAQLARIDRVLNKLRVRFEVAERSSYALADKAPLLRVQKIVRAIERIRASRDALPEAEWVARNGRFLAVVAEAWDELSDRIEQMAPHPPTLQDMPAPMRRRFVSDSGREAVYIIPKESLWNLDALLAFNRDVATVVPDFTGIGALLERLLVEARAAPGQVGPWVGVVIVLVLLVDFRAVRPVVAACAALALGVVAAIGVMAALHMTFTPINILAVPLLMGVGIDNSVHVLHRMIADPNATFVTVYRSTGKAVSLASATSLLSFGVLALTSHRGLGGFAIVMSVGIVTCYLASVLVLPCAWHLTVGLARAKADRAPAPAPGE